MDWKYYYGHTDNHLGMLPMIILESDSRPIAQQVTDRYAYGGGWSPNPRFKKQVGMDGRTVLVYPGDEPLRMLCESTHPNGEHVALFEAEYLCVTQKDGAFQVSRIDR